MSVWACADLHGCKDFYNLINNSLAPGDIIYFLGDACDRGPDGYELIKLILNNPQWIYIMGNHEELFTKAARIAKDEIDEEGYYTTYFGPIYTHFCNGGQPTLDAWINDGMPMDIIQKLERLPDNAEYVRADGQRVFMNHSGFMCPRPDKVRHKDAIWDRGQIKFYDYWAPVWPEGFMVHGHTPIFHMPECATPPHAPYWYCDNHKCNLDMGAVFTNKTVMMNLDTWEYKAFSTE